MKSMLEELKDVKIKNHKQKKQDDNFRLLTK